MTNLHKAFSFGWVAGLITGTVIVVGISYLERPYCPTEDSCAYDHRSGQIVEVTP